ncbi:alpha/beta hydrolase [Rhodococcus sp. 06-156-3C]|uniref:alpha/beta fold hydrolase n=1 Tax=Nocardiaceae TaxID=85025 RepID=UPI0009B90BD3|nr:MULTISPECIES: alpha/beta hydrolase [Rhodococcus]OZD18209.1 alpha/beta hydrolase [Rhodococcus sp. 06-156-4C]OZD18806.1 alpha/beta hydrolase [Rhodococcus sp. 06-156-3C]OZD22316.1 alpha/beta hydrolase [Rhodococcus sp. 06-156-4a]OZD34122.1 alpha/beta hydrolase [Rhodococcus sp. 06-156-3b]OZD38859.1 alpha/beta hydrolase [Rhodococcus sp. 06-156-3]
MPSNAHVITTSDGVEINYETFGDVGNPPLLLIQGLSAQMIGWHPDLCDALANTGFLVVRHDNRDVGRSQKFPSIPYTLTDMANDTAGLLTSLGIESAHIVGQSMGGMIAQELAVGHPHKVRSLALVYSAAHIEHLNSDTIDERSNLPAPRTREEYVDRYLRSEAPCASESYPHDEKWLSELARQMYDVDPRSDGARRQYLAIANTRDRRPLLPRLKQPTTILHGDSDALINPDASRELHRLIAHSTLKFYPGMGHALPRALWGDIVAQIVANCRNADSSHTTDTTEPAPART